MTIGDILRKIPVMPVITIEQLDQALPIAEALLAGGISVMEITLRSAIALEAIALIQSTFPEAVLGAGTVTTAENLQRAAGSGAQFAVSPGLTDELAAAALTSTIPLLPGVMTPTEVMRARAMGFEYLKLFPAEAAGGISMLQSLAGPFQDIRFCPTGGIRPETASAYLKQPNVVCVGGSWLTPRGLVERQDWAAITRLAQEAMRLWD